MPAVNSNGVQIYGLEKVMKAFDRAVKDAVGPDRKVSVRVGFRAPYAIYVHEDLEAFHPNGEAKFLEKPARKMIPDVGRQIAVLLKQKKGLRTALLAVGNRLLSAAQRLVPVDTGKLKKSGFVKVTVSK